MADRTDSDDFHRWLDELPDRIASGDTPEEFRQIFG
jgi:hypothetical protein